MKKIWSINQSNNPQNDPFSCYVPTEECGQQRPDGEDDAGLCSIAVVLVVGPVEAVVEGAGERDAGEAAAAHCRGQKGCNITKQSIEY